MEIKSATDWQHVHWALRADINSLGFNPDFQRMLNNITNMVTELSKAEVEARRIHKDKYVQEPLAAINKAIKHLEQFLLMAKLMQ
jgi:hypothetical protein